MKSKHYTSKPAIYSLKVLMACLIVIFVGTKMNAQSVHVIKGTVKTAEDNQPLPGANIYLKSLSSAGTFSDAKGEFEFPRLLKKGDTLVFSFLGLKTIEYAVPELPVPSIEIEMEADLIQMVDEILVESEEPARVASAQKRIRKQKGHR